MKTRNANASLLGRIFGAGALFVLAAATMEAQVVIAPTTPQVGSSNPVTAEPLVSRPNTKPCIVPLFTNLEFADYNPKSFPYTPPSACPGPWSKVVFTADFTVTAGRQYDRTAAFYLGHANIFYGTTAEPRAALSPSWHVERDVTDLSAIFKSDQTGEANLGNFVGVYDGVTYNGIIYANAALEFYPASWQNPPAHVPEIVVPVNGTGGDAGTLNTTADQITQTLDLPTNVEQVYLDVIAQSQSSDEFWYFCVPNNEATNLESCGNTAFRETEVSIDGKPAGLAPVYPWIYTGGIDPYLWEPIPGNQTLDFKPFRVNLTPFAGLLSDGHTHTIGVSVYNADSYFLATANVLVYTDHGSKKVTGEVTKNTLSAAPSPVVDSDIKFNSATSTYTGSVSVGSQRSFTIRGYVNTSHGRVNTTIEESAAFLSDQQFKVNSTTDIQNAQQTSVLDAKTTTTDGFFQSSEEQHFSYPLNIDFAYTVNNDGTSQQVVSVDQRDYVRTEGGPFGFDLYHSDLAEETKASDTLKFDASGTLTGAPTVARTTQTYRESDSFGHCYDRTITAAAQKLTSVSGGEDCGHDHR